MDDEKELELLACLLIWVGSRVMLEILKNKRDKKYSFDTSTNS